MKKDYGVGFGVRTKVIAFSLSVAFLMLPVLALADTLWTSGLNNTIFNANSGNVGIGTTTPLEKFSMFGGYLRLTSTASEVANNGTYWTNTTGNNDLMQATGGKPSYSSGYKVTPAGNAATVQLNTPTAFNWYTPTGLTAGTLSATLTPAMTLKGDKLGIGTTTPNAKLTISSSGADGINIGPDKSEPGKSGRLFFSNATVGQSHSVLNDAGNLKFLTGGTLGVSSGSIIAQVITKEGRVGFGTTSPLGQLSVTNVSSSPSFIVEDSVSPDATPFVVTSEGSLGVGTANPQRKLHVSSNASSQILLDDTAAPLNQHYWSTASLGGKFYVKSLTDNLTGTDRLVIDSSGKVGIGTTAPTQALDINGSLKLSGSIVSDGDICIGICQ